MKEENACKNCIHKEVCMYESPSVTGCRHFTRKVDLK
jgi:hypothetical protein